MLFNKPIPADNGRNKFKIVLRKDNKKIKTIYFGALGYQHYTSGHLDEIRKNSYINRHKSNENWNNELTAGYYSYNYLWRFKSFQEANKWLSNDLKKKGYN